LICKEEEEERGMAQSLSKMKKNAFENYDKFLFTFLRLEETFLVKK
jgi:hypothetical protein